MVATQRSLNTLSFYQSFSMLSIPAEKHSNSSIQRTTADVPDTSTTRDYICIKAFPGGCSQRIVHWWVVPVFYDELTVHQCHRRRRTIESSLSYAHNTVTCLRTCVLTIQVTTNATQHMTSIEHFTAIFCTPSKQETHCYFNAALRMFSTLAAIA